MPRNGVKRKLGRQRTLGFVTLALFVTASAFGATMAVTQPPSSARTSSEIQLTSAAGSHLEPRFSPDGKYNAYA